MRSTTPRKHESGDAGEQAAPPTSKLALPASKLALPASKLALPASKLALPASKLALPVPEDLLDQVVQGDCLELLPRVPSGCVHLAITSPPYNVGLAYDTHNDAMTYDQYLAWLARVWAETKRVLAPGGRFAINIAPTSIKNFRPIHYDFAAQMRDLGMIMRTEILWYKQTMLKRTAWGSWKSPANPHIVPSWEYVLVFSKDAWRLDGDPADADITPAEFMKCSDGFWYIPPETNRHGHPAPFPEELIYRLIKFYTYRGNVVLDMFGGTGTVAHVAQKTGRHFLHTDLSAEYCDVARRRLAGTLERTPKRRQRTA